MSKSKIAKFVAIGAVGSLLGAAVDRIADRPDGSNPTPKRLAAVIVQIVVITYAEAAIERFVNRKMH